MDGGNNLAPIKASRIHAGIHVRHEGAEHQHAVGRLQYLAGPGRPDLTEIVACKEGMPLRKDRLAVEGCRDRQPGLFRKRHQLVVKPEAADLSTGIDSRLLGYPNAGEHLGQRLVGSPLILRPDLRFTSGRYGYVRPNHVPWDLDVAGALGAKDAVNHAIHLGDGMGR